MIKKRILIVITVVITLIIGIAIYFDNRNAVIIWSHLSDKETRELTKIAKEWGKISGSKVKVYSDRGDAETYIEAVKSGKGPDVEFGIQAEAMGELINQNLVNEMPEGLINTKDYVKVGINAVTYKSKLYALPLFAQTYALYYNKDMIKNPPQTLEELVELSKKYGFQYEINNIYYSYAFLEGFGAKIFPNQINNTSIDDVDLGNIGAIKGYEFLRELVQSYGLMPRDAKFSLTNAKDNFIKGRTGLYISEMFDLETLKKAGVNFGVSALPKLNGNELKAVSRIEIAFVSSKSIHKDKAWDLIKFISTKTDRILSKTDSKLPTLIDDLGSKEITENPLIAPFAQQLKINTLALNSRETLALKAINNYLHLITCENVDTKLFANLIDNYVKLEMLNKYKMNK